MLQDLKAACRDLIKSRWFTSITVLTLALGIGANTAIFSVVNRMVLNPLPYADASRIVHLRLGSERFAFGFPTQPFLARAWRDEARSLDGIEAFELQDVLAYDDQGARVLHGIKATPGLLQFLGVQPVLGRAFAADDTDPASPRVALLSYATWQHDYGGGADALGRAITLDDVAYVVIGVMPAGASAIAGPQGMDIWLPLSLDAVVSPGVSGRVEIVARLRPGIAPGEVTRELDAITARVRDENGARWLDDTFARIAPPGEFSGLTRSRDVVLALFAAVGLLLLVACANVANLLLARGAARSRGFALRAALGASPWRLVRSLLAECVLLALAAGAAGIAVGWATLTLLVRLRPGNLVALDDVSLDPLVLAFALGLSILTAFVFGSAPALQLARSKFGDALRHGATGTLHAGRSPVRKLLVGVQMAISVLLLVSAGLLVRSVYYLQHVDIGFDTENLVNFQLALPRARYESFESRDLAAEQLLERVRSLPGVAAATQAFLAPPNYIQTAGNLEIRGVTLSDADARAPYGFNYVRSDYFATLGVGLVAGRAFTADEQRAGTALVVSRAAAQWLWPRGDALGSEVKSKDVWATVVGIADDVAAGGLLFPRDAPLFYWPFKADRVPTLFGGTPSISLTVRTNAGSAAAIGEIRAATQAFDPEIAIRSVLEMKTAMAGTIDWPRFNMALFAAFALVAVALAAVGLAAVIGYEINERTREIGIRLALGARAKNVRGLSMRHGLVPALVGLACGTGLALGAASVAASLVHGVTPRDPLTFSTVIALLLAVALAASWVPALRAARVDPIRALRAD